MLQQPNTLHLQSTQCLVKINATLLYSKINTMLSVIIITKNESINIRRCLESVQWVDEIIVVDSGSLDNTVFIAKEFTDKVYETDWPGYGVQKQRALSYATGDWVLNIDADETVNAALKNEITQVMAAKGPSAYRVPSCMNFYGKPLRYSGSPKRHIRLFKRAVARYSDDIVHEKILLQDGANIGQLNSPIMHHSYRDLTHALDKINLYSSYSAKIRIKEKKPASLIKTILGTGWMFFRCFVLQRGFMDGQDGFVIAVINAQGTLNRGLKQLYQDSQLQEPPKIKSDKSE